MNMNLNLKKLIAAVTCVAFVAGCASKMSAPESVAYQAPPQEFADLRVVNGKPFGDMYFQHYGVNPTIDTEEENVSTFSVDVDTASYSLARSYLSRGHLPEEAAVRVEEFVNAFDYDYLDPGDAPFGVQVEAFPSPNRKGYHVLHVGLRGKEVTVAERKPANMVFTIDVSGSMDMENRLGLVKKSLTLLVEELDARDTVAIVVYGSSARAVLEPTRATDKARILSAIHGLSPEGSTNAEAGLRLAYALAAANAKEGVISRVILCSDGVANVGRTGAGSLWSTIEGQAKRGVWLTTVGFGMGNYNDVLMEQLAHRGDGQYAYVDDLAQARRLFVEQLTGTLQTIAKDVKIQVEFDKRAVARYRLIGFENRMLENRDFANDRVDAGDVGAGHTVTALYEVKFRSPPAEKALANFATLRIRYKEPVGGPADAEASSKLVEKALPTEVVRPSLAQASGPSRLSLVVALFAEKLRGSYWARNVSYGELHRLWSELPDGLRAREQVTELRQLITEAQSLDKRGDKFEKAAPVANMDFDHVPVVR